MAQNIFQLWQHTQNQSYERGSVTPRDRRGSERKKEIPRVTEIKLRQLWMKDLGRDEKRSPFRVEKESEREEEGGSEGVDVFDLELYSLPVSQQICNASLSLSDSSPSLITFVTVNHLWLWNWNRRSGPIKTLFHPHHKNCPQSLCAHKYCHAHPPQRCPMGRATKQTTNTYSHHQSNVWHAWLKLCFSWSYIFMQRPKIVLASQLKDCVETKSDDFEEAELW